jgi:hypothetical protein
MSFPSEIWLYPCSDYEYYRLLKCDILQSGRNLQISRRNVLLPSLEVTFLTGIWKQYVPSLQDHTVSRPRNANFQQALPPFMISFESYIHP